MTDDHWVDWGKDTEPSPVYPYSDWPRGVMIASLAALVGLIFGIAASIVMGLYW